jgi:hypothetical protein
MGGDRKRLEFKENPKSSTVRLVLEDTAMPKLALLTMLSAAALCLGPRIGAAAPISQCTFFAMINSVTCDLQESDANGNPSETGSPARTPNISFSSGWIVLTESQNGSNADPSNWSDLVFFSNLAPTVELISDPDNEGFKFPITVENASVTAQDVVNGIYNGNSLNLQTQFVFANKTPTVFGRKEMGRTDTINVFSDVPVAIPIRGTTPRYPNAR